MAGKPDDDNGVSGLPEDWGRIVIPDDVSQLADLVAEVQQELRYDARVSRRERRMPFIVLVVTVIVTLASLFTVPWFAGGAQPEPPRPTSQTRSSAAEPAGESSGESAEPSACGSSECGSGTASEDD